MAAPVRITFRDMTPSPAVTAHAERRAAKLQTVFSQIIDCHVVVGEPHRHSRNGQKFHVRIDLRIPGKELVVSRNPEEARQDVHAAMDDAFDDAVRILEQHTRQLQSDGRSHASANHGLVTKVFHDRGYGFIEAAGDGHEVYFHRNSVLDAKFEAVAVGTKVRFAEEDGDKGPQASTVHVL